MDKVNDEKGVIVEGLEITFYMHSKKVMVYDCDNLEQVIRLVRAWMRCNTDMRLMWDLVG